jgi:6-phosphogluconolactonase/glucosamine-6-phosphate isomerase/deaminase
MLVGVGLNGHIAMNEPGTSFDSVAHISTLAEETKTVGQKYFDTATQLSRGITLGLKHFRDARLPILVANGEKKAHIIRQILTSSPSESLPASIIQLIDQGMVMLDEAANSASS